MRASGICDSMDKMILAKGGWGVSFHWVIFAFDCVAEYSEQRPHFKYLSMYNFWYMLDVIIRQAVHLCQEKFLPEDFRYDFLSGRSPRIMKCVQERHDRLHQFADRPYETYK